MKRILTLAIVLAGLSGTTTASHAGVRIGGGVHYLHTLGDIKDSPNFESNSLGYIASATMSLGPARVEGDFEWVPNFGGSDLALMLPQAYAMVGSLPYFGLGIGASAFDGEWEKKPFYALRAGANLAPGGLDLDVFATYRFLDFEGLGALGTQDADEITFGAIFRFGN